MSNQNNLSTARVADRLRCPATLLPASCDDVSVADLEREDGGRCAKGHASRNNLTLNLVRMLKRTMQKKPQTFTEQFNSFFTSQMLLAIIGTLLGIIAVRLLGL